jgi:LPS export ABC transporter protein LptC
VTRRSTRRGIILLTLLATLSWILTLQQREVASEPASELDLRLNYALYDFEGRLLDDDGGISLEIQSPKLRNNARSGVGTLESPEVRIQQEDERWYITAEAAIITADREYVSLMGDVNLKRLNDITGQQLDIQTKDVMLNVTPRTARTEAQVNIRQDEDWLDATGMHIDMIGNRFELMNEVRAHYEIP